MAVRTFVLVHPAWFGGWCWNRVAGALRAGGHDVLTPTLTGLGSDASEGSRIRSLTGTLTVPAFSFTELVPVMKLTTYLAYSYAPMSQSPT